MKTPRPYQQAAIDYMAEHNTYLCDSCGLGKTLMAIETAVQSGHAYGLNLVVCRRSAKEQWAREIMDQIRDTEVTITDYVPWDFHKIGGWFICHFEELVPTGLLYQVARITWDVMIVDEAHRLRNHSVARSKNITRINAGRKIALSATPVEKHGGELWPLLKWLAPEKFPAYWKWAENTFDVRPGFFGGRDVGDPLDMKAYQEEIRPYIIMRKKEDVAPELPPRIDTDVIVSMLVPQQEAYDKLSKEKDVLVEIEDVKMLITNALTLFTKLHQVSVLPAMIGLGSMPSGKIDWLKEFVEDHANLRLLVFSRYREVVERVSFELQGYGVLKVMSGVNESDRFKNGFGKILAGTIDAMSESLSLEMADAAIFLDQHWSATQMQQAVDRIHRMNIVSTKFIYYLISSDVDQRVMDVVRGKYDEQRMLLDFVRGK